MPMTPRGLYRVKLIGELHGQATETAFHFTTSENSGQTSYYTELLETMQHFQTNMLPKVQAFCSQQWVAKTLIGVTLIPKAEVFIEIRIPNGTGFQTDDSLPSFCAGLLSLRTGLGGRSRIGRIYLPGVAENLSSLSRLDGTYLSLLAAIGSGLTQFYGATGSYPWIRYGVFSRKLGVTRSLLPVPSLNYNIAGFKIVNSTVARPEVATMRRRKLARGI